jgi:hypothetical protein
MNAATTSGEDKTAAKAAKRGDGESGKNPGGGPGHDAPPVAQPMTDSDKASAGMETPTPDNIAATSGAGSGSSTQTIVQPAGDGVPVSEGPPRRRRGILLGTGAGAATPAAVDDEKSLSWMATQAVKAVNAVKASQLEQAQAWKAEAGTSDDEPPRLTEGDDAAIERQEPAQSFPGGQPVSTEAVHLGEDYPGAPLDVESGMSASGPLPATLPLAETTVTEQSLTGQPVEPSQKGATNPRIPAGAHRATASLAPVRMALMLGVLAMFSYAGYRYWFAGDHTASEAPGSASAILEPTAPSEEAELMTPPPISVVPAPQPSAGSTKPEAPAVEAGTAPTPGPVTDAQPATAMAPGEPAAEEVNLMTPPPISVVPAPEPAAEHSTPPAVEAEMAPTPGPATDVQPATARVPDQPAASAVDLQGASAGDIPPPAQANPPFATVPETWYPSGVPAAPSQSVEADMSARQPMPPSSTPPAEAEAAASQPAPTSTPPPAVEAKVPARPAATPAPAARPRYPANGYGYYQPPGSWQPYYRPGYPQAPARQ